MGLEQMMQAGVGGPLMLAAAVGLGALHALEPGHAKTLMAAFLVAIRGTVRQAALLALSVAVAHTLVVWLLAFAGWRWGTALVGDDLRPYCLIAAGIAITLTGLWTASAAWRRGGGGPAHRPPEAADHAHPHPHPHPHVHAHPHPHVHAHAQPHVHPHPHAHSHPHRHGDDDDDAHARAHAAALGRRLAAAGRDGGAASDRQVVLFGLSGGMIPCQAAVAVLILCLQQNDMAAGIGLVAAFTVGLAAMLAVVGFAAASATGVLGRLRPLGGWMRHASAASGAVLAVIGLLTVDSGLAQIGI